MADSYHATAPSTAPALSDMNIGKGKSASGAGSGHTPALIKRLAVNLNGCKDTNDGIKAKQALVLAHVAASGDDLLDVLCWLHHEMSIAINSTELLQIIEWQKPASVGMATGQDASNPGMFLASVLDACIVSDMKEVVERHVATNIHVDVIEMLRFIHQRGFLQVDAAALRSERVTNWKKPLPGGKEPPTWKKMWEGDIPSGPPTYVNVRTIKGQKARLAFLGAVDDTGANPTLKTPADILLGQWRMSRPNMCINADAGSMHPRQADSANMMWNLPQFHEWVRTASPHIREEQSSLDETPGIAGAATSSGSSDGVPDLELGAPHDASPKIVNLQEIASKSIDAWQRDLPELDADDLLADSSINNIIYVRLKEVFSALLDAATLSGSWIVVDRTGGQGSATAEVLLELALARGAQRPVILAVDSLERLGKAREGSNAHGMLRQLNALFNNEDAAHQNPNGTEKEPMIDFLYQLELFDFANEYCDRSDLQLPFEVLEDHKRVTHGFTCDPNRKWRYYYVDGLFSNATHYIIKNNDQDEFDIEGLTRMGFLYAHGDTRTFKRLRANIQQGKSIVMLHNSGGVVTAFSWLQLVMAFAPQPPDKLRGPLKFLIANLSKANWINHLGVPEMIMMKGLADRAPQLFRKQIVSVDILTDSEEQTLEVITGCFAQTGGVPELGLGNAEVNVILNAWNLHLTLVDNAKGFWLRSVIAQTIIWTLALATTILSISTSSLGTAHDPAGMVIQRFVVLDEQQTTRIKNALNYCVITLPIVTTLVTTVASRLLWRDKWSVCTMAATQLVTEIYKFRMLTQEYDMSMHATASDDGEARPPLSAKMKAQLARQKFVKRIQTFYGSCVTELSQGGALKRKRAKVSAVQRQDYRTNQESRPTLAQWFKVKRHVEEHFFQSTWALPSRNFLSWVSGLRPYLQHRMLRDELRGIIEGMVTNKQLVLGGKALDERQSRLIRYGLASALGLKKAALDAQADELRQLQREILIDISKENREDGRAVEAAIASDVEGATAAASVLESGGTAAMQDIAMHSAEALGGEAAGVPASGRAVHAGAPVSMESESAAEDIFTDEGDVMRKHLMALQGMKYGQLTLREKREEQKKRRKAGMLVKDVEDDYLFGPMSVESFVIFFTRPLIERYKKQAAKLAFRLNTVEVAGFFIISLGTVFAVEFVNFGEWVSLTVATVAILTAVVEFTQLRNQVVSINLTLGDLQNTIVWWDSLSVLGRRTDGTKSQMVSTTERALLQVVDAYTTAASNTQKNAATLLTNDGGQDESET